MMGVAGSGKTRVGQLLAERLGWTFAEADDFHSPAHVAKMAAGTALTDRDRQPWLETLRDWIDASPGRAVITCSALRRRYRDVLAEAGAAVRFLHLHGSAEILQARIDARVGHFMPATLLASQLATLEPLEADEDGVIVDVAGPPEDLAAAAMSALGLVPGGEG